MPTDPVNFYDSNAVAYAADGGVNPRLTHFMSLVPRGGRILELGTGSGMDAMVMINAGFAVEATDGSRELAKLASDYLGQTVRVMRFEELSAERAYDGIYASASLLHVPRANFPGIVRKIHAALAPNGVLWASFKSGTSEGSDSLGRYYNYLGSEELKSVFAATAHWAELETEEWQSSGFDRQPTRWTGITARR